VFLAHPLLKVVSPFRPAFTGPTWKNTLVLVEGTLLHMDVERLLRLYERWDCRNMLTSLSFITRSRRAH